MLTKLIYSSLSACISAPEVAKQSIFEKTAMIPAVNENGTLFVPNHKLTLEILKEISDFDDVLEVAGEDTGSNHQRSISRAF